MNLKALILVLLVAGLSFSAITVPSWTLSQNSYKPGADGVVTVVLSNPVISGADVKVVNSLTVDITSPPQIGMQGQQFVGDIEPGGTTQISLPFKVSPNASSAIYSVELKLSGFTDNPTQQGGVDTFVKRVTIPITVVNQPQLSFSTDTPSLSGIDNVSIKITNNGGKASNLKITIASSSSTSDLSNTSGVSGASSMSTAQVVSPIAFYGIDQIYVPNVDQNASVTLDVPMDSRNAPEGPTDVPLLLQYDDELGISHTSTASLRLTVRNEKLDLGIVQQSDVFTKRTSNLTLEISNNGPDPIKDVRLSFQNSSVRLKNQDELKFGDLAPGQSATVSAVIDTDLPPGVNNVASAVSWIDKDVQKEESRTVPITVTSDADVGVYLEAKPLPMTLGAQHTLSVLVSNLGSYRIDNVDVTISSPALSSLDISNTQYIGGLNNDDFSTVQFLVKVNATTAGSYPIRMVVNYRDQSGELKQKVIDQMVNVYSPPQQEWDPLPIVIGVLIILVAVWWFKFRKK
jgi:hypothetical protein